jgi:hypothetical protein
MTDEPSLEALVANAGHAAGLWTHTPVDWGGNEGRAKPANWPKDAVNGNPGNGTRPGAAMPGGVTILSATPGGAGSGTCTVTWTTQMASDSTVNYGPTSNYTTTVNDPTMVTAHSVALTGLPNPATIHYSVTSSGGGYSASSIGDNTFTTT